MDINYTEEKELYRKHFSLGCLGSDINNKFACISLTCYLYNKLKEKISDITYLKLLKKVSPNSPDDLLISLAIICEDFSYECKSFPTFGIKDKDIPDTLKGILSNYCPF